jgi:superfamily II DNA or RNA helicase
MEVKLREYQSNVISKVRKSMTGGHKQIVIASPTGAGKTIMFTHIIKSCLDKGNSALLFTHRKELLTQAGGAFAKFGLNPELITAGSKPDLNKNLHVAMIETFNGRIEVYKDFLDSRTLIVIDEAHLNSFTKIFPHINKDTYVFGVTATPYRKGKASPSLSEFYTKLIQGVDTPELISLGFLSKANTFGIHIDLSKAKKTAVDYDTFSLYEENKTYRGVVKNWVRLCEGSKTLLFASNVKSSKQVCTQFNSKGYEARHVDSNTPQVEREGTLKWFNDTKDAIVCNCGILTAGYDQPDIETIILYRATTSLPLFLQMCGRGSRVTDIKKEFTILDFGNNIGRFNFWEESRTWSLEKDDIRISKEGLAPVKECPSCAAMLHASLRECPHCGHIFKKTKKEEEIELQKLFPTKQSAMQGAQGLDNEGLVEMCKAKLISPLWVLHNKKDCKDAKKFVKLMGWDEWYPKMNKNRFKVFSNL